MDLASLKLMLQPLVENAIYHGMEFMDGDGEIRIKAWRRGGGSLHERVGQRPWHDAGAGGKPVLGRRPCALQAGAPASA